MVEQYSDTENFNLIMNFICPKCHGITSQGTFFIEEELTIIHFRICYHCISNYSVTTTFDNIRKFKIFKNELIKNINNRDIKTRTVRDDIAKQVAKDLNKFLEKVNKYKVKDIEFVMGEGGFNN